MTWSEGSGAVDYHGSWTPAAESTALGGALTASEIAGSTAILTFKGRDIGWIAPMGPAMGLAKVYVDGSYVTTIDLYAASPTGARIVYRRHWGSVGTHKLKVLVVGTAGHPAVAIDAFAIFR
jgi:hypothetical protein